MRLPLQIAFHNMSPSDDLEAAIRAEAERLEGFCDGIMSCRVVVDQPHRHHKEGNCYEVRIDLKLAGREIAVERESGASVDARDIGIAVRNAFDEARRQLEDIVRVRRGDVKTHDAPPHARVARTFPEAGYGFLETRDGRSVYFHRNSVLHGDFEKLAVGTEVSFVEEEGERGPQASTVRVVGRHGHAG